MGNIQGSEHVPREVTYAGSLLIWSFLLGLIPLPIQVMNYVSEGLQGFALFFGGLVAIFGAFTFFLVSKIKRRKNWARWIVLFAAFLNSALIIHTFRESWNASMGETALGCLTGLMELVATGILFARRSNDWFADQLGVQSAQNSTDGPGLYEPGVTGMGYICPCCGLKIAFFSKVVNAIGNSQVCPYCNKNIKRDIAYGKFFALMLLIGFPVRLLGKGIPVFSFFSNSVTTAFLTGFLIMLCTRFKQDSSA